MLIRSWLRRPSRVRIGERAVAPPTGVGASSNSISSERPFERIAALSITCWSSRTLPGQSYSWRRCIYQGPKRIPSPTVAFIDIPEGQPQGGTYLEQPRPGADCDIFYCRHKSPSTGSAVCQALTEFFEFAAA